MPAATTRFKGSGRAIGKRGLAPVQAATGQMVLYSAGAGQEALDRLGGSDTDPNGLFTRILIREIKKPGVPANQLLKNVSYQVVQLAKGINHDQVPALYDQTIGDYYFVPKGQLAAPPPPPSAASAETIHMDSAGELEQEFWNRIKDSTDPADFSDYTKQYPQGAHAAEAAITLRRLKRVAAVQKAAVSADAAAQPATRTKSLPVSDSSTAPPGAPPAAAPASPPTAQASGSAITPGSYGGYTTEYTTPGKVLGRLMLGNNGEFVYRTETGATVRGTFDLSKPDNVTGKAVVTLDNGNSARMLIQGKIAGGKLLAKYKDEWGYSGDIVLDLGNPL